MSGASQNYVEGLERKVRELEGKRDALADSLRWTASALQSFGRERDILTIAGESRTVGEVLDAADAALEGVPVSAVPAKCLCSMAQIKQNPPPGAKGHRRPGKKEKRQPGSAVDHHRAEP